MRQRALPDLNLVGEESRPAEERSSYGELELGSPPGGGDVVFPSTLKFTIREMQPLENSPAFESHTNTGP